jgi:hypothetical protein
MNTWEEIRDAIVGSVKERTKDFLASNKDAETFLRERAERFAKLAAAYAIEIDPAKKDTLLLDMRIVKQTMENEITTVLVNAESAGRSLLKSLMGTVFDFAMRALPTLAGIL